MILSRMDNFFVLLHICHIFYAFQLSIISTNSQVVNAADEIGTSISGVTTCLNTPVVHWKAVLKRVHSVVCLLQHTLRNSTENQQSPTIHTLSVHLRSTVIAITGWSAACNKKRRIVGGATSTCFWKLTTPGSMVANLNNLPNLTPRCLIP